MRNLIFKGARKFVTIPLVIFLGLFFLPLTILLLIVWLIYTEVPNRKVKFSILSVVAFFVILLGYILSFTNPTSPKLPQEARDGILEVSPVPEVANKQSKLVASPISDINRQEVKVAKVIDGDTIEIEGGKRVRYIGIDAPESYTCFSSESKARNKELVGGKTIILEKDISETDRYGRLLRYVYIDDTFVNEILVKEGYAQVSTYPPDVKYQAKFLAAQKEARDNNRGLWSSCFLETNIKTAQPTSRASAKPFVNTNAIQTSDGVGSYTCDCSKTCSKMSSCDEAQYQLSVCGCKARDTDNDGIACDRQCQ